MSIWTKIIQADCCHSNLEIKTISYGSETMTSTAIDHEIVCSDCNKVLLNRGDYQKFRDLIEMWETM